MSSEDLLTKFDELAKGIKNDEIIEDEREKIKAEVEAFNEEKKRMQAFVVRDDDIIHLNVSGQKFKTKRSTLCQVEGSLFATMFSGRWEDSVERDQDGAVFFDFDSQHFAYILKYLKERKITSGENSLWIPDFPEDETKWFYSLVEYLGLSDEMFPPEMVSNGKLNLRSQGFTLEEDGKVAVHDGTQGHQYVLGENIYEKGIEDVKLKLESFKENHWMFILIVTGDVVPPDDCSYKWPGSYGCTLGSSSYKGAWREGSYTVDNTSVNLTKRDVVAPDNCSYKWPGSYGWALGSGGGQGAWREGSHTVDNTLVNLSKQGDEGKLILDFDTPKLSLHFTTGHQFHIDIPKNKTWRLNVDMCGLNDKIRIIDEWFNIKEFVK